MDAYQAKSEAIMQIVAETGATLEPMSIDEAYPSPVREHEPFRAALGGSSGAQAPSRL
jgi:nucleotidyltransferase/DNA polymerase involved in DNA repair